MQEILRIMDEEILIFPEDWTIGYFTRDKKGRIVHTIAEASCFCIMGAAMKAANFPQDQRPFDWEDNEFKSKLDNIHEYFLKQLFDYTGKFYHSVADWNDNVVLFQDVKNFLTFCRENV